MFTKTYKRAKKPKKSAIIIGAGASGLSCAEILVKSGKFQVRILQAGHQHGGRVRKLQNFTDFPIEKGGEELHMTQTPYYGMCERANAGIANQHELLCLVEDPFSHTLVDQGEFEEQYKEDTKVFQDLAFKWNEIPRNMTVEEYIRDSGCKKELDFFFDAHIATEHGSTLNQIGAKAAGLYQTYQPHFTEGFILTKKSHFDVLENEFKEVLPFITYDAPVSKIDYTSAALKNKGREESGVVDQKAIVTLQSGEILTADYVICTVPISQLKKGVIAFEPSLPLPFQAALTKIDMDYMGQYFLQFKQRFWPEDLLWLTTEKGGISWASSTGRSKRGDSTITFHVAGEKAKEMMTKEGLQRQTDIMLHALSENFKVDAASLLEDAYFMDWSSEPFIEGGYSYPGLNEGKARDILFKNLDKKVFFAGEACSKKHYATIHGAIETGISTAEEILGYECIAPRL